MLNPGLTRYLHKTFAPTGYVISPESFADCIRIGPEVFVMPEQHKIYLGILAKDCDFYPIIQDTKNTVLFEVPK